MPTRSIKRTRQAEFDSKIEDSCLTLPVSSEVPADFGWGMEVLVHDKDAVDLSRFKNQAMALFNHHKDKYVAVIEDSWLEARKIYVRVRFDCHDLAKQIRSSIEQGILRNVSIGYMIGDECLRNDCWYVTKWEPYEFSFVTIPLDPTVGVNRSMSESETIATKSEETIATKPQEKSEPEPIEPNLIIGRERDRSKAIRALCNRHNRPDLIDSMLDSGIDLDGARSMMLDELAKLQSSAPAKTPALGLSRKEQDSYSLKNVFLYQMGKISREKAGLEIEASRALEEQCKIPALGLYIPTQDLPSRERAVYLAGSDTTGAETIETEVMGDDIIYALRNLTLILKLGAQFYTGLVGNVSFPKQSAISQANWIGENEDIVETNATIPGSVTLTPKKLGAISTISNDLFVQSSSNFDNFIRRDISLALAEAIDLAAFMGNGTSQPQGVFNASDVNILTLDGNDGSALTWSNITSMIAKTAASNAFAPSSVFITNSNVMDQLMSTEKYSQSSGQSIWDFVPSSLHGMVAGRRAYVTEQIPSNFSKGNSSNLNGIFYGNPAQYIVGGWGGMIDILVSPYGEEDFKKDRVSYRAIQRTDIKLRYPQAFTVCKEVLVS